MIPNVSLVDREHREFPALNKNGLGASSKRVHDGRSPKGCQSFESAKPTHAWVGGASQRPSASSCFQGCMGVVRTHSLAAAHDGMEDAHWFCPPLSALISSERLGPAKLPMTGAGALENLTVSCCLVQILRRYRGVWWFSAGCRSSSWSHPLGR